MLKYISLTLLIISYCHLAFCETFRWVDERGNVHYTDDFTRVPEKHRSSIKRMEGESSEPVKKEIDVPVKPKEAAPKDRLGRGEEYWKERVEALKSKIRTLQDKNENLRLRYNELTTRYNDSKSSVERANLRAQRDQIKIEIDQNKAEIEEAKTVMEKKIPEEAEFYKAKPEWIK